MSGDAHHWGLVYLSAEEPAGLVARAAECDGVIQGPEIADHAFALLLSLTRDIKRFGERMGKGWERRSRLPMVELTGRTALVIGLGGIGTQVAQRAAAFGMRLLAVDLVDVPMHREVAYVGEPDELDALLPEVLPQRRCPDPT